MRLHELQKQIEAGVAVRRRSWADGVSVVSVRGEFHFLRDGSVDAAEGWIGLPSVFADDWERADGLGCETADVIEDRCDVMFTVAMLVKDALNHPGESQVLEVITEDHLSRVVGYLESFSGLEHDHFAVAREVRGPTFRVRACWLGDKPSKKQPPANFKRIHTGRDTASESGKEAS